MMISLIVATCGRLNELRELLDSLETQEYCEFEVIVVDQNQELDIGPVLVGRRFPIRRVRSAPGASIARNVGLRLTKGEILAFPDDDCLYEKGTLAAVKAFFEAHAEVGAVIGKWKACKREEVNERSVFWQAGTCFYFMRRTWIDRIGEFDETLGPGPGTMYKGGEDTDYLIRGLRLGMRIWREPDIVVRHPEISLDVLNKEKVRAYGVARSVLLRKHRYPLWFKLANVVFPLVRFMRYPSKAGYWLAMFRGRWAGLWK